MATDKKGFILYADQKELFDQLPSDKAGELIKFIFSYVNDEDPTTDDLLLNLAFTPIKQQFKRDLKKWESTREGRSKAGKASAEARKKNKDQQTLTNSTSVNKDQQTLTNSTVNDNVNVNVNVNVKDKEINIKEVDLIYSLYPTKCKTRNSSTGKTEKNKDQIKKLLKTYSVDKISNIIKRYTLESDKDKVYMKNFSTFLNNLPDYESKEVDVFELEDKYIYFQWKNDATATARRTPREGATKMFENQAKGGYTPVFLESIKGKTITWKQ